MVHVKKHDITMINVHISMIFPWYISYMDLYLYTAMLVKKTMQKYLSEHYFHPSLTACYSTV